MSSSRRGKLLVRAPVGGVIVVEGSPGKWSAVEIPPSSSIEVRKDFVCNVTWIQSNHLRLCVGSTAWSNIIHIDLSKKYKVPVNCEVSQVPWPADAYVHSKLIAFSLCLNHLNNPAMFKTHFGNKWNWVALLLWPAEIGGIRDWARDLPSGGSYLN